MLDAGANLAPQVRVYLLGVIYTLAVGLSRGGSASVFAAAGCTIGAMPHVLTAVLGLAALMHTSALAFQFFKYAGAAYLLYMAWSILKERGALDIKPDQDAKPMLRWFPPAR